jgi:hypothetical protein
MFVPGVLIIGDRMPISGSALIYPGAESALKADSKKIVDVGKQFA